MCLYTYYSNFKNKNLYITSIIIQIIYLIEAKIKEKKHTSMNNSNVIGDILVNSSKKKTVKSESPKKIEKALIESQKMLQKVINSVPQHIFWKDKKSVFLGCNENFAKTVGLKNPEDIIGKTDFDLIEKEKACHFIEIDKEVMNNDQPKYNITESHKDASGKQRWLSINKVPLHDAKRKVIGILGTFEDVTLKIELENKLKQNEEKYRSLIEATNSAYIITNTKFEIIETNKTYIDLMGYQSEEELKGKNPRSWVISEDIQKFDTAFKGILNNISIVNLEIHLQNNKGQVICVIINGNIIENGGKKIFCLIQNVSNRRTTETKEYIKEQKQKDRIRQNIVQIRDQLKKLQLNL